jgi:phosphoribosylpyrophosphate synthetase
MSCEVRCGRLGKNTPDACAEKAARTISERGTDKPTAVCVAPDGVVTVEALAHALDDDLVGVYDRRPGYLGLWRILSGDLMEVAKKMRRPA